MKVYVIIEYDDGLEDHRIYGVYATRERAQVELDSGKTNVGHIGEFEVTA